MVNEEKIRIMTQIALDEEKKYKTEIEESGLYPRPCNFSRVEPDG